jgi:hypothetical protein
LAEASWVTAQVLISIKLGLGVFSGTTSYPNLYSLEVNRAVSAWFKRQPKVEIMAFFKLDT